MTDKSSNQFQLDLFAPEDQVQDTAQTQLAEQDNAVAGIMTSVAQWAASAVHTADLALLETLMTEGSRKVAFNGLEQEQRDALALAVRVVANAKRSAYEKARRGEHTSAFDWHRRDPHLSLAIELLNASFIDTNAIAMS